MMMPFWQLGERSRLRFGELGDYLSATLTNDLAGTLHGYGQRGATGETWTAYRRVGWEVGATNTAANGHCCSHLFRRQEWD